jgi:hypothetical protein
LHDAEVGVFLDEGRCTALLYILSEVNVGFIDDDDALEERVF